MENATFRINDCSSINTSVALGPRFLWEYLFDGRTPIRALSDKAMRQMACCLEGPAPVVELGAAGDYYKKFFPAGQPYMTTNIAGECDRIIDMEAMDFPSNSISAFLSIYAVEHLFDYEHFFEEVYRTLSPSGRFLIIAPFMYYYHAAPDDYFRFSRSALERLLGRFRILKYVPLGNREIFTAEMYHEKKVLGSAMNGLCRFLIRLAALPVLACGLYGKDQQQSFVPAHLFLVEKPAFNTEAAPPAGTGKL